MLQRSLIDHLAQAIDADLIISQHEAIVRAIRRHQRIAAERAMRNHIEYWCCGASTSAPEPSYRAGAPAAAHVGA